MDFIVYGVRRFLEISYQGFLCLNADISIADRLPRYPALRTVKLGLLSGLGMGILQDAIALAKGRRLSYVDFILRRDQPSVDSR